MGRGPWLPSRVLPGSISPLSSEHTDHNANILLSWPQDPLRSPGSLSLSGLISSPSGEHGTIWQLFHNTLGSIVNGKGSLRLSPNDTMQPSSSKCLMPQFLWQLLGGCCLPDPQSYGGVFSIYNTGATQSVGVPYQKPSQISSSYFYTSRLSSPL